MKELDVTTVIDQAIAILKNTNDGDALTPANLRLVESAVNGGLSDRGIEELSQLHHSVLAGTYAPPRWLPDIEHLTKDATGYVYWKGQHVEHYSFTDPDAERQAAARLAGNCLKLEALGIPVMGRTATHATCYNAEPGTPWKLALQRYYHFFDLKGMVVGVFYRKGTNSAFAITASGSPGEAPNVTEYDSGHEAYHSLENSGATSLSVPQTYPEVASLLERLGIPPDELDAELTRSIPAET